MNSRIGVALLILVIAALGWTLKEQIDVNREIRAKLVDDRSQARSAEEVFRLRSMCVDLGQRIIKDGVVGSALTQDQVSHYNQQTNRCYVEVTVHTMDASRPDYLIHRYLYDGQTKEMLANANIEKGGKKHGMVFDQQHQTRTLENAGWDDANSYINAMMLDDRR
jgi:hypothetical protein